MKRITGQLVASGLALLMIVGQADAQRRGGGGFRGGGGGFRGGGGPRGGGFSRGMARSSVTRPSFGGSSFNRPSYSRPSSFARPTQPISRPANIGAINRAPGVIAGRPGNVITSRPGNIISSRPGNIINNRPINVGDIDVNRGYGWNYNWDGCCYYGSAWGTAAGVAAGALATAAVGSAVYDLPSSCTSTVVNGVTYMQCGDLWYQPQFEGTTMSYVVVNPP